MENEKDKVKPVSVTKYGNRGVVGSDKLGKEVRISPKSLCVLNGVGYGIEFMEESVTVLVGIGKDEVGYLVMSKRAHMALLGGEKISIDLFQNKRKGSWKIS